MNLLVAALITLAPLTPIQEDDPAFDCIFDGNRICGPTNSQGAQPGCYNDLGALVAPWPCHIIVNSDGSADVYEGAK